LILIKEEYIIQGIILKLKEISDIQAEKCENGCRNCPLNKDVLRTEIQTYDICDLLNEIIKKIV